MTLYIDLILLENIVMNYIIILATGMVCRVRIKHIRIILSSLIGAIYAAFIYIIDLEMYTNYLIKILISVCMVYIAFKQKDIKIMVKHITIFYLTSFCFGGAAYFLLQNLRPTMIKTIEGILVGSYPIKIALLGGILGFFVINISFRIIKTKLTKKDMLYDIDIFYKNKKTSIKAILDTGNMLADPITNTPVLIVESKELINLIPKNILENIQKILYNNILEGIDDELKKRCSIIPFSSIGQNNGMIIGFRPDYINIHTENGEELRKKVIIGIHNNKISNNEIYSGLIGLNLLNQDLRIGDKNEYNSITKI